jgi:hypothetical protein
MTVERDTVGQPVDGGGIGDSADARPIDLGNLVPRVGQARRQITVVGQEQQAFRVVVEPADRVEVAEVGRDELEHRAAALRVEARRHHPGRLVDQDVSQWDGRLDFLAVDRDGVGLRVGLGAEVQDRLAVDGNAALDDETLGGPARDHAGAGEDFL